MVDDATKSILSKLGERKHQGFEEGGVVGPSGVVGVGVPNLSSGAPLLNLRSCGGEGLGKSSGGLLKGCARMADRNGHELHLSPHRFESGDEWGVLGGLLLKPLVAS